jgi:hypothetical protein
MIRSVFTFTTAGHTLAIATTVGSEAGSFGAPTFWAPLWA